MKPHAGLLMEMNSPDIQVKLQSSHCEIIMRLKWFFFFFGCRRRAVNSLTQSCGLLDFRCVHVNNETAWRRTSMVEFRVWGQLAVFHKEAFICIWQAGGGIPPQISPVCNPAVERQTLRQFLELKGTILFFYNEGHDTCRWVRYQRKAWLNLRPISPKRGQN